MKRDNPDWNGIILALKIIFARPLSFILHNFEYDLNAGIEFFSTFCLTSDKESEKSWSKIDIEDEKALMSMGLASLEVMDESEFLVGA